MFSKLTAKFRALTGHRQALFAFLTGLTLMCMSWAIQRLLEVHIFPEGSLGTYTGILVGGSVVLWLIKHVILHVI